MAGHGPIGPTGPKSPNFSEPTGSTECRSEKVLADHFGGFRAWIPERSNFFKGPNGHLGPERSNFFKGPKGPKGPLGPERSDFFRFNTMQGRKS